MGPVVLLLLVVPVSASSDGGGMSLALPVMCAKVTHRGEISPVRTLTPQSVPSSSPTTAQSSPARKSHERTRTAKNAPATDTSPRITPSLLARGRAVGAPWGHTKRARLSMKSASVLSR